MEHLRLKHPLTAIIAGPTGSGKTYFVRDLLKHKPEMFSIVPDKIVWFYGIYQPLFNTIDDVTFVEGLPSNYEEYIGTHTLFIIDDLMTECGNDKRLTSLFTKGSHHLNLSIFFIVQNFFHSGSQMREISLNANYLILFKNRRDMNQITHLGRQIFPRNLKFFQEIYDDATKKPYSYLFVDLRNDTPEELRLRTQILPNQDQFFYQLKTI